MRDNPVLASLTGLSGLRSVDRLTLTRLPEVADLAGLSGLTTAGELWIDDLPRLDDLYELADVSGYDRVTLRHLPLVDDLSSLTALRLESEQLTDLAGVEDLSPLAFDSRMSGNLWLDELPALVDLTPVDGVLEVDTLYLRQLGATSLNGLESIGTVNGNLYVTDMPWL